MLDINEAFHVNIDGEKIIYDFLSTLKQKKYLGKAEKYNKQLKCVFIWVLTKDLTLDLLLSHRTSVASPYMEPGYSTLSTM